MIFFRIKNKKILISAIITYILQAKAEAKTYEAEAKAEFFDLEAEAKP